MLNILKRATLKEIEQLRKKGLTLYEGEKTFIFVVVLAKLSKHGFISQQSYILDQQVRFDKTQREQI